MVTKAILFGLVFILSIYMASAVCTVTFDRSTNYSATETIAADSVCSGSEEKNDET